MPALVPMIDTSGTITKHEFVNVPSDYFWFDTPLIANLRHVKPLDEIAGSMVEALDRHITAMSDSIENMLELHKPLWWKTLEPQMKKIRIQQIAMKMLPGWEPDDRYVPMYSALHGVPRHLFTETLVDVAWIDEINSHEVPWSKFWRPSLLL